MVGAGLAIKTTCHQYMNNKTRPASPINEQQNLPLPPHTPRPLSEVNDQNQRY